MNVQTHIIVLLSVWISSVSGHYCYYVWVSGALYTSTTALNGEYAIWSVLCNANYAWYQFGIATEANHIYFIPAIESSPYMWVIGTEACEYQSISAKAEGYYEHPYDVPTGQWQELNPSGNWESNPNLSVNCDAGLSSGAIVGIVIGCVMGAILLIGMIALLFSYCKHKHRRSSTSSCTPPGHTSSQSQQTSRENQTGRTASSSGEFVTSNSAYCLSTIDSSDALYSAANPGFTMTAPPPYDSYLQPPKYEDIGPNTEISD